VVAWLADRKALDDFSRGETRTLAAPTRPGRKAGRTSGESLAELVRPGRGSRAPERDRRPTAGEAVRQQRLTLDDVWYSSATRAQEQAAGGAGQGRLWAGYGPALTSLSERAPEAFLIPNPKS